MKRNFLALALVAGMATMTSGLAMAQSQDHGRHGHHAQHGQHGRDAAEAAQSAPAPQPGQAMAMDCPMIQGGMMHGMMRGMMPMGQMRAQAYAQGGHNHAAGADIDMSASSIAFRAVNEAMHHDMDIPMTGDADVDFVRGMIAHHVGAVNMARIVQIFGSNPEIAALAEEIIEAQEAEIAMMRDWLARNAPDAEQ
ncbi:MAG: CopM family metallochaperone [Salinarimonas sp.]